jgi:hypothetical protein
LNPDYKKIENNIQYQKFSCEGFKKLEEERGDYYNIRNVDNYYLSNMENVQDHLCSSMNIAIPADHKDYYNELEYMIWVIVKDIMKRYGEDMIDNPYVDKNNPLIIHPKLYIISFCVKIFHLLRNYRLKRFLLQQKTKQGIFGNLQYNLTYNFDEMTEYNLRIILRLILVDLIKNNILEVFNDAIELLKR